MADLKISQLTGATTPLAGTEVLPIVQSNTTKQVSVANLTAGRAISVAGVTDSSLTASTPVFTNASKKLVSSGTVPVANGGFGNTTGYLPYTSVTFTDLSTTSVDVATLDAGNALCVSLFSVDSCDAMFLLGLSFNGSNLLVRANNISGATVGTSGDDATIQIAGDARTYTIGRNASTGYYQIKASSTATGTTTFRFAVFGRR